MPRLLNSLFPSEAAAANAQPLASAGLAPARNPVDEGIDRGVERSVAVERLERRDERERRRAVERVERAKLLLVVVADRAEEPLGLSQGIAKDEGVEGEPESGGLGVDSPALRNARYTTSLDA